MTALEAAGEFSLDGREAYALIVAALEVVSGPSPSTHARVRRAMKSGAPCSYPGVRPGALVELVDVLEAIRPGMATGLIAEAHKARQAKRRAAEARYV